MKFLNVFKSIPIKKMIYAYIFVGIVGFMMVFTIVLNRITPNKVFYQTELIGQIKKIYKLPRSHSFWINGEWYLIKGECVEYMSEGDFLIKRRNSYLIKIINGENGNIKYEKHEKFIIFKNVGNNVKPKIPFSEM